MERIKTVVNVNEALKKEYLATHINNLNDFLNKNYEKNILIEKIIMTSLFVIAVIILFVLFIIYQRSLKIKDDLFGFKSAIENSDNSIVITDAQKNITYVNEVFEKETGYKKEDIIGKNPRILKSGEMSQSHYDRLNKLIDSGQKWEGEFINLRKDRSIFYEKASIIPIYKNDKLVNYLAIKLNITEYIEKKREIEFLAYHDALTSLPNRSSIEQHIEREMLLAKRNESRIAVLFIDLDRFKIINDTLGHDVGDEILIQSAKRIKESLRKSDMPARNGGDEFIGVLDNINDEYCACTIL